MGHDRELRHCVYCRRAGRECDVVIAPQPNFKRPDLTKGCFTVRCDVCGAEGPREKTKEEAEIVWNQNTAIVADTKLLYMNASSAVRLAEEWKGRAIVNMEISEELTGLLNDVRLLIESKATEIAAKFKGDPRNETGGE